MLADHVLGFSDRNRKLILLRPDKSRVTVVELGGLGGERQRHGQYGVYFSR